jgi:phosphoglycolate phosphatase
MNTPDKSPAVLFDLDGTLVDSLPGMLLAMNKLLAELGNRPATADELRSWVGDGVATLVARGVEATGGNPHDPPAEMVARYLAYYRGHTAIDSRPYPGVLATLETLKLQGHPLGVCTNKLTDLSVELLDALGMTPFFSAIVGGDSAGAKKPDPRHLLATLERMGAAGRKAVMVGDSGNDVAAARAAGMPVVVMSQGYAHGDPRDLGADLVIDHFADLPTAIDSLVQ